MRYETETAVIRVLNNISNVFEGKMTLEIKTGVSGGKRISFRPTPDEG